GNAAAIAMTQGSSRSPRNQMGRSAPSIVRRASLLPHHAPEDVSSHRRKVEPRLTLTDWQDCGNASRRATDLREPGRSAAASRAAGTQPRVEPWDRDRSTTPPGQPEGPQEPPRLGL